MNEFVVMDELDEIQTLKNKIKELEDEITELRGSESRAKNAASWRKNNKLSKREYTHKH